MSDNEHISTDNMLATTSTDQQIISAPEISSLIYTIRGKQVMLDKDLAHLYGVETRTLNQAVKRNPNRFPSSFCFTPTQNEMNSLRSQIVILPADQRKQQWWRYPPNLFTEQGVAMLSAVLKSETAVAVSIKIMDTFVELRRAAHGNLALLQRVDNIEARQLEFQTATNERFDQVFNLLETTDEPIHRIYFQGQVWDALSLLEDLVHTAEHEIILVDGYIDKTTLDILSHKRDNVTVHAYTLPNAQLAKHEVTTFNAQYPTLEIHRTTAFHDRYLVLDGATCYHIGASLKDAGKKGFGIDRIQDKAIIHALLTELARTLVT